MSMLTGYTEALQRTALDTWFPVVRDLGLAVPRTTIIETSRVSPDVYMGWYDQEPQHAESWQAVLAEARRAVMTMGLPCFLRTAYTANKHEWERSCYCTDLNVGPRIQHLIEFSLIADQPLGFLVVREFLRLRATFTAFRGMPIAREFRFFVNDGEIAHVQPYWPVAAIRLATVDDWRERLAQLSQLDPLTRAELERLALHVNTSLPGYWSIDFAQDVHGKWWLTDMADGHISFCLPGHWEGETFVDESQGTSQS